MFGMFMDPRYLMFMLPAFVLMLVVQWYVKSAYTRWSQVISRSRISGAQAAQRLMQAGGLSDVRIEGVQGHLTDHYDPRSKVLRLSQGVYQGNSVAALAIAAHELGHAMQDSEGYFPLRFRSAIVPVVNVGSYLGWISDFRGDAAAADWARLAGRGNFFRRGFICTRHPAGGAECLFPCPPAAVYFRFDCRGRRDARGQQRAQCRRADLCSRPGRGSLAAAVLGDARPGNGPAKGLGHSSGYSIGYATKTSQV